MGFSRQEYWSGLPFPTPGDLSNKRMEPVSFALQADSIFYWWAPLRKMEFLGVILLVRWLLFSPQVMSVSLQPYRMQHAKLSCSSPSPGVCPGSCPLNRWCHPTISSSVTLFFCLQSFPVLGSFSMSWLFPSGGQSIVASASILEKTLML